MKKIKIIILIMIMLVTLTAISGCTTPGTDFDTVRVVATVARNGGDFTLTPSGESGYDLHVVVGTLSIEALGQDLDSQSITNAYKIANNNRKQYYENIYGGGIWGGIRGWLDRSTQGLNFNTIGDLALSDGGGLLGFDIPQLKEIDTLNYLGGYQQVFDIDSGGTYTIPNYGLGIYASKIPRNLFPDNRPDAGYVVVNNWEDPNHKNGIIIQPSGKNTGFVVWDNSDYWIVVLTNQPAFADDTPDKIWASVELVKPDVEASFSFTTGYVSEYLTVYYDGMANQLSGATTDLLSSLDTTLNNAVDRALSGIPGSRIVKSLSDIGESFTGGEKLPYWVEKDMEETIKLIFSKKDIYRKAWNQLYRDVHNFQVKKQWTWGYYTINLADNDLSVKDLDHIIYAYTNDPMFGENPIYQKFYVLKDKMKEDETAYYEKHNLQNFYKNALKGHRVTWQGPLFSVQLLDNGFLGVFDGKSEAAIRYLLDIDWDDPLSSVNITDLDKWREDFKSDIIATVQEVIPDYIAKSMEGVKRDVSNLSGKVEALNSKLLEMELQLKNIQMYIKRMIPDVPLVKIFAYQIPSPIFTKVLNDSTGDFIQADPTSIFSAAVSVVIGDTTNWSLVSGYPRAVIKTQSRGILYVALEQDSDTGSYVMRQDMVGDNNLVVGDTISTYFEVKVTNTTEEQNMTAKTLSYYTKVMKSWLSEFLNRIGITVDELEDFVDGMENWFDYNENPFDSGNSSGLDSFFAILTVRNDKGEELYVKSPRKDFKMSTYDSEYLSWDVRIFEDKQYTIDIVIGNNTVDSIVSYRTKVNAEEASWMNPLDWGTKFRELI